MKKVGVFAFFSFLFFFSFFLLWISFCKCMLDYFALFLGFFSPKEKKFLERGDLCLLSSIFTAFPGEGNSFSLLLIPTSGGN